MARLGLLVCMLHFALSLVDALPVQPTPWLFHEKNVDSTALFDVFDQRVNGHGTWRCPFDDPQVTIFPSKVSENNHCAVSNKRHNDVDDCPREMFSNESSGSTSTGSSQPYGDVIFFVHTSTESLVPSATALCAIESAAQQNPKSRVRVLSSSWKNLRGLDEEFKNLRLVRLDFEYIFSVVPELDQWFKSRVWAEGHRFHHLSDGLRLALLYGCGGTYLDTDVISVRSLEQIQFRAFMGIEMNNIPSANNSGMICNAVMRFSDRHRSFVRTLIKEFTSTFQIQPFGWNGPSALRRVWSRRDMRENELDKVHLLPRRGFYDITWSETYHFFQNGALLTEFLQGTFYSDAMNEMKRISINSAEDADKQFPVFGIHLWQSQISGQLAHVGSDYRNAFIGRVFANFCPRTFTSQWPLALVKSSISEQENLNDYQFSIRYPASGAQIYGLHAIPIYLSIHARDDATREALSGSVAQSGKKKDEMPKTAMAQICLALLTRVNPGSSTRANVDSTHDNGGYEGMQHEDKYAESDTLDETSTAAAASKISYGHRKNVSCVKLDEIGPLLTVPNPGRGFHLLEARLCRGEVSPQDCLEGIQGALAPRTLLSFSVDFNEIQAA